MLTSKEWGVSPHDPVAEDYVLRSVMLVPQKLSAASANITPEDFFGENHQAIFRAVLSVQTRGEPVDPLSVARELEQAGKLNVVGGLAALNAILESGTYALAESVEYYARLVKVDAIRRGLIRQAVSVAERANSKAGLDELRPMLATLAESVIDIDETTNRASGGKDSSTGAGGFVRFPVEALPWPLDRFITEAADALRCDPCYIALPMLSVLAGAVGNSRVVKLKRKWSEPCLLWTVIVSASGTMKSPAWALAKEPLDAIQSAAFAEYRQARLQYDQAKQEYDAAVQEWKRSGRQRGDAIPLPLTEPIAKRYLVDDLTVETLAPLLEQQPRGLTLCCDELAGWFGGFNQYRSGRGSDVERWLSIHRAGPITVDRKTDHQCRHIPRACISVTGGIQPKVMSRVASNPELRDNGLLARLLVAKPPRRPKQWSDADVSEEADAAYRHIVERLLSLDFGADEHGNPVPIVFSLSPDAKEKFVRFFNAHNREQSLLGDDLSAAWSKLEAYAPRLALLIQLVRWAAEGYTPATTSAVDEQSMDAAIVLVKWFANEAKRVSALLGNGDDSEESRRRRLAIDAAEQHGGRLTVRALMRSRAGFKSADDAEQTLNALVAAGLGHWEQSSPGKSGGRPTTVFVLVESASDPAHDSDATPSPNDRTSTNSASGEASSVSMSDDAAARCFASGRLTRFNNV